MTEVEVTQEGAEALERLGHPATIPCAWKGGFDQVSWMGRYAEYMMRAGMQPYEAECWALNAWEASDDDAEPEETASADLSYAAEDAR